MSSHPVNSLSSSLPSSFPDFYDANRCHDLYIERAGLIHDAATARRKDEKIYPSAEDAVRIAAFGIDCQIAFCTPGASLFVTGADVDTKNTVEWIYKNITKITSLYFSLDTHNAYQIFHPAFWQDISGNHPAPFTVISAEDVKYKKYRPVQLEYQAFAEEYTQQLAQQGRYVLTVWPYHALQGGLSHALVPSLMEAALYHSFLRQSPIHFENKGEHPLTENYSVLSPEVTAIQGIEVGAFRHSLLDALLTHERIYVFGQAKSHCVLSTLRDIKDEITRRAPDTTTARTWLGKIYILQDAMSPVAAPALDPLPDFLNFPALAEAGIQELAAAGMQLASIHDAI